MATKPRSHSPLELVTPVALPRDAAGNARKRGLRGCWTESHAWTTLCAGADIAAASPWKHLDPAPLALGALAAGALLVFFLTRRRRSPAR